MRTWAIRLEVCTSRSTLTRRTFRSTTSSREVYYRIFDLQKPVIAQIHGYCLAGATHLAGFCDLRYVSDDAQIGFPVAKNLTIEGFQYEIWLMGVSKAKHYLMTGDPMSGKEAYDCGWASKSFPADKLNDSVGEYCPAYGRNRPSAPDDGQANH